MTSVTIARMPAQLAPGTRNAVSMADEGKSTALLVAGIDYPRRKRGNEDAHKHRTYFDISTRYKDFLFEEKKVDRVIIFDFLRGETVSFDRGGSPKGQTTLLNGPLHPKNFRYCDPDTKDRHGRPRGSTLKVTRVQDVRRYYFTSIDDLARQQSNGNPDADVLYNDYEPWSGGSEKSMSISDVYDMFTRVASPRYQELHFFGHATDDGPVIVNTDEYESKFFDKDPRRNDFLNPKLDNVFGPSHIAKSRASFRSEPVVCIWGCDVDDEALLLIQEVRRKDAKKQNYDAEVAQIRAKLADTYAARLAKAMRFRVLCALPGMDAVHEGLDQDPKNTSSFRPKAMHVSFTRHEHHMELYKKYLGTQFATTGAFTGHARFGRGYAFFDP